MTKPMSERKRMLWGKIRERGWLRYVVLHGVLQFGFLFYASVLLAGFIKGGQAYAWREQLLFNIPWCIALGITVAAVQWRGAERRYPLEPLAPSQRADALEKEISRMRGFILFLIAAVLLLAATLLRG